MSKRITPKGRKAVRRKRGTAPAKVRLGDLKVTPRVREGAPAVREGALREPDLSISPPPPKDGEIPEVRRLLRRAGGLDRRKLRLLILVVAALAAGNKGQTN